MRISAPRASKCNSSSSVSMNFFHSIILKRGSCLPFRDSPLPDRIKVRREVSLFPETQLLSRWNWREVKCEVGKVAKFYAAEVATLGGFQLHYRCFSKKYDQLPDALLRSPRMAVRNWRRRQAFKIFKTLVEAWPAIMLNEMISALPGQAALRNADSFLLLFPSLCG